MGNILKKVSDKCRDVSSLFGLSSENTSSEDNSQNVSYYKESFIEENEYFHRSNFRQETRMEKYSKHYISQFLEMNILTNVPTRNTVKEIKNSKISLNDFEILKLIGAGSFGKVFLVRENKEKMNKNLYAMKILEKDKIIELDQVQNTLTERELLETLSHPFISKLSYAFQDANKLYLLTDFMPGGDLTHRLTSFGKLSEYQSRIYACEIFLALEFLHENNIIFRDLKPENILLDKDGHIKLTDFGLSKKFSNKDYLLNKKHKITFSICGTYQYIAPEVYQGMGYAQEIDWWSYGIVLYEMLTGKFPFKQNPNTKKIIPIVNYTVNISPQAKDLIEQLLNQNVSKRLFQPEKIKNHIFFEGINWDDIYNKRYSIDSKEQFNISETNQTLIESNFDKKFLNNNFEVTKINEQKEKLLLLTREDSSSSFLNFSFSQNQEIIA